MATLPASESTLRASAPVFVPASERECMDRRERGELASQDGERCRRVAGRRGQDGHWTCRNLPRPVRARLLRALDKVNLIEGEAADAERDNDVKRAASSPA